MRFKATLLLFSSFASIHCLLYVIQSNHLVRFLFGFLGSIMLFFWAIRHQSALHFNTKLARVQLQQRTPALELFVIGHSDSHDESLCNRKMYSASLRFPIISDEKLLLKSPKQSLHDKTPSLLTEDFYVEQVISTISLWITFGQIRFTHFYTFFLLLCQMCFPDVCLISDLWKHFFVRRKLRCVITTRCYFVFGVGQVQVCVRQTSRFLSAGLS